MILVMMKSGLDSFVQRVPTHDTPIQRISLKLMCLQYHSFWNWLMKSQRIRVEGVPVGFPGLSCIS